MVLRRAEITRVGAGTGGRLVIEFFLGANTGKEVRKKQEQDQEQQEPEYLVLSSTTMSTQFKK